MLPHLRTGRKPRAAALVASRPPTICMPLCRLTERKGLALAPCVRGSAAGKPGGCLLRVKGGPGRPHLEPCQEPQCLRTGHKLPLPAEGNYVPCVDGSELARTIFSLQRWLEQPGIRACCRREG